MGQVRQVEHKRGKWGASGAQVEASGASFLQVTSDFAKAWGGAEAMAYRHRALDIGSGQLSHTRRDQCGVAVAGLAWQDSTTENMGYLRLGAQRADTHKDPRTGIFGIHLDPEDLKLFVYMVFGSLLFLSKRRCFATTWSEEAMNDSCCRIWLALRNLHAGSIARNDAPHSILIRDFPKSGPQHRS